MNLTEPRKRNWFPDTWSLIVIEDKVDRPEPADRNAEILRWAVSVPGTQVTDGAEERSTRVWQPMTPGPSR